MTELVRLVEAAQQGDREAFGQIVIHFQDMAFAGAYARLGDVQSAQDTAQEAFWEAYRNLDKLREPAAFPGWFRRIVQGCTHRTLRRQPALLVPLENADPLYTTANDPGAQIDSMQLQQDVAQALNTLPEAQRLAIVLFYIEGYSYQEIADFLEAPISTVKKRLFDARRKLKGRMIHMVQDKLQQHKPSQDATFAQTVQFFLALLDQDLATVQRLVQQNQALLTAQVEWQMALGLNYWPIGSTALHLVAGAGRQELLAYLLTQPVDAEAKNRSGMTPLHIAATMGQKTAVQLLLDHGVASNPLSASGQTPLHQAVLRNNLAIAELLLQRGADPTLQDAQGRTAMDWAVVRQNEQMVEILAKYGAERPADFAVAPAKPEQKQTVTPFDATQLLGAILTSSGAVRERPKPHTAAPTPATKNWVDLGASPILQTGIKFIDLLAPLARGGQNGIFTPLSGVGLMVVIGQLIDNMKRLHGGYTVWLMVESEILQADEHQLNWRELGVDQQIVTVAGNSQDTAETHWQTIKSGLSVAEQLRASGNEVLLLLDSRLAEVEGVLNFLRANTSVAPNATITTLVHGHHTVGVLPAAYAGLDTVLTFDYTRAIHRLYPALDPVRSDSTLFQRGLVAPIHQQVAQATRQLLQRYADLRPPMEQYKLDSDALWYVEDDPNLATDIKRARRLDRFLTQPFHCAEPWSGIIGQVVPLAATLAGCQAILNGAHDALPEEAFSYIGAIEEAVAKAPTLA